MESSAAIHPADETLVSYGLGKLEETVAGTVSQHLEQCAPCRQRVAELSGDSFVGRLRQAQPRPAEAPARPKTIVETEPHDRARARDAGKNAPLSEAPASFNQSSGVTSSEVSGRLPPELVNHPQYEVIRELGRGGMGVVYLARNKLMDRLEVLKLLSQEMLGKPERVERFLREIQAAAKLHHPNVVAAYTAFPLGKMLVFAMEYVEGDDLAKLVRARGPLPILNACYFAYQTAQGLQHAHERGMIHRDIKPGNLILFRQGKKGTVKILDFGLAKVTSEQKIDGTLTQQGQMLGTPDYIAPEQTLDAQKADIRSDIYSLGCTLYQLLTGNPPFSGNTLYAVLQAHHVTEARMVNLVRPEVPVELAAVVAKMMAKDPSRRYQTPAEVAQALKPFLKPGGLTNHHPELEPGVSKIDRPSSVPLAAAIPIADDDETPHLAPMQEIEASERWKSLIDTPSLTPSGALAAIHKRARRQPPWMWPSVAAGFVILAVVTAVVVIHLGRTTVVIDVHDPGVEVAVKGTTLTITGPNQQSVKVVPGDQELTITSAGLETTTKSFTIKKGEKKTVTVSIRDSKLVAWLENEIAPPTPVREEKLTAKPLRTVPAQPHGRIAREIPANDMDGGKALIAPPTDGFVPLFNGKDFTNWTFPYGGQEKWSIGDGIIRGDGFARIVTARSDYQDFHLRLEVMTTDTRNKAFIFRSNDAAGQETNYRFHLGGLKFDGKSSWDLGTYLVKTGGGLTAGDQTSTNGLVQLKTENISKPQIGTWHKVEIVAIRNAFRMLLDGREISVFRDDLARFPKGQIVFGVGDGCHLELRGIEIKEFSPNGAATAGLLQQRKTPPADADRKAAQAVSSLGGTVTIRLHDEERGIGPGQALPDEPFVLLRIELQDKPELTDADLAPLEGISNLTSFDVRKVPKVTDAIIEHLQNSTGLQSFWFEGAGVGDAGLQYLERFTKLKSLGLRITQVGDDAMAHLERLTQLEHLALGGSRITSAGLSHVRGLTRLGILWIENTAVTDSGLAHLQGLSNLKTLTLFGTKVGDSGVAYLEHLSQLEYLDLSGLGVTDVGIGHLRNLTNLKTLWIKETRITDAGAIHLSHLSKLEKLGIQGTRITDAGLLELKSLANLNMLLVDNTSITPAGQEALEKAKTDYAAGAKSTRSSNNGFNPLFNREDLTGWTLPSGDEGSWTVKDEVLHGFGARSDGPSRLTSSRGDYSDFVLRFELRSPDQLNKHLMFRTSNLNGEERHYRFHLGGLRSDGTVAPLGDYFHKPGGRVFDDTSTQDGLTALVPLKTESLTPNRWHRVELRVTGYTFRLLVDRREVSAFQDEESRLKEGQIVIAVRKGGHLELRNIEINTSPEQIAKSPRKTRRSNKKSTSGKTPKQPARKTASPESGRIEKSD
jgi:serine/threonine protein kinase